MTRKRFIKLCMANGMQRNEANEKAKKVCMYGSYELMYRQIEVLYARKNLQRFAMAVRDAIRPITNQYMQKLAAICAGVSDALGNVSEKLYTISCDNQKLKMAVDWFQMSNDDFYNTYEYPGLYEAAREIVYGGE